MVTQTCFSRPGKSGLYFDCGKIRLHPLQFYYFFPLMHSHYNAISLLTFCFAFAYFVLLYCIFYFPEYKCMYYILYVFSMYCRHLFAIKSFYNVIFLFASLYMYSVYYCLCFSIWKIVIKSMLKKKEGMVCYGIYLNDIPCITRNHILSTVLKTILFLN